MVELAEMNWWLIGGECIVLFIAVAVGVYLWLDRP